MKKENKTQEFKQLVKQAKEKKEFNHSPQTKSQMGNTILKNSLKDGGNKTEDKEPEDNSNLLKSGTSGSEFKTLSEWIDNMGTWVPTRKVKEFIKKLKDGIEPLRFGIKVNASNRLKYFIDKLAGEKLICN